MQQALMREEEKKKSLRKAHFPALNASDDALMFSLSVKFFFFFFFSPRNYSCNSLRRKHVWPQLPSGILS